MTPEFVDTNVFAYAYGSREDPRAVVATELLTRIWRDRTGALSVQVLQELYVTLTRKVEPRVDSATALARISSLRHWRVFSPKASAVVEAVQWEQSHGIHFWDAMILVAAQRVGASIVWSEDLNDGQSYDGVVVRSPFSDAIAGSS